MIGKVTASLMAIVLVLGLAPVPAHAGDGPLLASASPAATVATQAKKALSNAQKKKMKAAYTSVLHQARAGSASYDGFGFGSQYAMFDMGNDGVPELFVSTSDSTWGGSFHVFDYASGSARHLGICHLSSGWLYGAKGGKLYLSSGRQGGYSVTRVMKSQGKIEVKYANSKWFIAKSFEDWDAALRRCNAYVAKLGAKKLKTKPVTSYALLNKAIRAA